MSHPNAFPGKTFIPYEGDMPVETTTPPPTDFTEDREGIAGVTLEERQAADAVGEKPHGFLYDSPPHKVYISRLNLPENQGK